MIRHWARDQNRAFPSKSASRLQRLLPFHRPGYCPPAGVFIEGKSPDRLSVGRPDIKGFGMLNDGQCLLLAFSRPGERCWPLVFPSRPLSTSKVRRSPSLKFTGSTPTDCSALMCINISGPPRAFARGSDCSARMRSTGPGSSPKFRNHPPPRHQPTGGRRRKTLALPIPTPPQPEPRDPS